MNVLEFVTWWLSQGENGVALVIYCVICALITLFGFINSFWVGLFMVILFGAPLVALAGYVINKEVRKSYNAWLIIKDKQKK